MFNNSNIAIYKPEKTRQITQNRVLLELQEI